MPDGTTGCRLCLMREQRTVLTHGQAHRERGTGGWRSIGMLTARQISKLREDVRDLDTAIASGRIRFVEQDDGPAEGP